MAGGHRSEEASEAGQAELLGGANHALPKITAEGRRSRKRRVVFLRAHLRRWREVTDRRKRPRQVKPNCLGERITHCRKLPLRAVAVVRGASFFCVRISGDGERSPIGGSVRGRSSRTAWGSESRIAENYR